MRRVLSRQIKIECLGFRRGSTTRAWRDHFDMNEIFVASEGQLIAGTDLVVGLGHARCLTPASQA